MSIKRTEVKADEMYQDPINWSGSWPISTIQGSYVTNLLSIDGGMKNYNKQATTSYDIESDWLTQDQVKLLEELVKSPQVLAYIHDPNNSYSDYLPYNVRIKDTSYETKNVRQEKLVQGKFTIEVSMPQKMTNTI